MSFRINKMLLCLAVSLPLGACFTGVESTPKIDASELKRAKASKITPEESLLADVRLQPASQWIPGKELWVTDPKIRMVLTLPEGGMSELNSGEKLIFKKFEPATDLMGHNVADVVFSSRNYPELRYRVSTDLETLRAQSSPVIEVPFTVDPQIARESDSLLRVNRQPIYAVSPLWYEASTEKESPLGGYRLVEVTVDSVTPGNHLYPLRIYFHVADASLALTPKGSGEKMMFSSPGGTRSFSSLFTFQNPRKRYPDITAEVWSLIINSQVQEGMTKEECRLALGSPTTIDLAPTRTGDVERWGYSDGVYLLFNPEGILTRYRL